MRSIITIAMLLAGTALASAQSATPYMSVQPSSDTGKASDAAWAPPAYGLATTGAVAAIPVQGLGNGGGTPGTVVVTQPPVTPEPKTMGKWIGNVQCDGTIQVCGEASRSRGWGFAAYNQHWSCSADTCNPLPATVAANGAACQTSMGSLGYVFGPQCYVGQQTF